MLGRKRKNVITAWAPTSNKPKDRSRRIKKTCVIYEGDAGKLRRVFASDVIAWIFYLVCAVVIAYGAYTIYEFANERGEAQEEFNGIVSEYVETEPIPVEQQDPDTSAWPPIVDFDALKQANSDVAAWIRIPGTTVDYPVLTNDEKDFYLRRNFYKQNSVAGAIFCDYQNTNDLSQDHIVVYGHHMAVSTMFADVAKYKNKDFFDKHRVVYFETPSTTYVLKPIGEYTADPQEYETRQVLFRDTESFQSYLDSRLDRRDVIKYDDWNRQTCKKLFTLITCNDNGDARQVLECVVEQEYPTSMIPNVINKALDDAGWSKDAQGNWQKHAINAMQYTPNGDVARKDDNGN